MKNLFRIALLLLVGGAVYAAPTFLARVELDAGHRLAMAAPVAPVVADVGEFCIVSASDAELSALTALGFRVTVLDRIVDESHYFVRAAEGFDAARLAPYCRVLARYSRGFIVAATDENVHDLTGLQVELARVARTPMVLSGGSEQVPALPAVDDSIVWQLVNRVEADTVRATIARLQAFRTRYSKSDSLRAACNWMRGQLAAFGCDSAYLDTWSSMYAPNVIGVKTGRVHPELIYVIDGHIDNTADRWGRDTLAPGADDNASGTAAVIEAARAFADFDFDCTVWFIGFSGEEQGLLGSEDFAQRCRGRGDSVCGVLNFDMISYGRDGMDKLDVIGRQSNPDCAWLMDFYIAQADTFTDLQTVRIMDSTALYSDHAPFWQQGYVAFCGIEDDFTPEYHTIGDTVGPLYYVNCGTNNWPMATEAIKAAVASLAKLAGASPRTGVEERIAGEPARITRVFPTVGRAPVTVQFSPRLAAGARVEVLDAAGNRADVLPAAGSSAVWPGAAAGVYLLRLTDRGSSSTAKIVLTE